MAHGFYLEASFESSYIHREDDQDHSPYEPGRNIYYDILHALPTKAGHGRMTRFSMVSDPDENGVITRYDIDWTLLPDNATPIHYMNMKRDLVLGCGDSDEIGDLGSTCLEHGFGFSYTDPATGEVVTKVETVVPA